MKDDSSRTRRQNGQKEQDDWCSRVEKKATVEVRHGHREFENGSVLRQGKQYAVECTTKRKGTGAGGSGSRGGKSGCNPRSLVERVSAEDPSRSRKPGDRNV